MIKFSVRKPLTVFISVAIVLVLGVVSYLKMIPDLLPNIDMPYAVVMTTYPGASPEKVESEVTKPLEQKLSTLDDIKNVSSQSGENYSMIGLEFEDGANMDTLSIDIMSDIDIVKGNWEETVGSPTLMKINPNMMPVVTAAVSYEGKDKKQLSTFIDDTLLNELEGTNGVAKIDTNGLIKNDVNVVLNQKKIDEVNNKLLDKVDSSMSEARAKITEGQQKLDATKSDLLKKQEQLEKSKKATYDKLAGASSKVDAGVAQLSALSVEIQTLEEVIQTIEASDNLVIDGNPQMQDLKSQLEILKDKKNELTKQLDGLKNAYKQAEVGSFTAMDKYSAASTQIAVALSQLQASQSTLDSSKAEMDKKSEEAVKAANVGKFVTMDAISGILKAQNFDMPAGYIVDGDNQYLVSVGDNFNSKDEVSNLVLFNNDAIGNISLSDVADVVMADNSKEIYANINGKSGVLLSFQKQSNNSTTEVSNNIAEKFETLEKKYDGLAFDMMMNQGKSIYLIIDAITSSLLWGALFAIIILFLFLRDVKPTLITLVSIPISLVFAIVMMYFTGVSINMISLSGLAVAVGMLVDNSIVVIENIYRLKRQGVSVYKAAVAGTRQVGMAVISSTLTTLCVFAPIVFVEGITRQLFVDMALTIVYALTASLIVALTLVPAMSSKMLVKDLPVEREISKKFSLKYKGAISWALNHKKVVLLSAVAMLGLSLGIALAKGFIFMPDMTTNAMTGSVVFDEKTSFEDMTKVSDDVIKNINSINGVKSCGGMISSGNLMGISLNGAGQNKNNNKVTIYVTLNEDADMSNEEISKTIQDKCKNLKCEVKMQTSSNMMQYTSGTGGEGVGIYVYSDDKDKLMDSARDIGNAVKKVDGIESVDDGLKDLSPSYHFTVDKNKAAKKGLTVAQVYQAISDKLKEEVVSTKLTWEGNHYDVTVVRDDKTKITTDELLRLNVEVTNQQDGSKSEVKVKEVAKVSDSQSLPSIERYNQRQELKVNAVVDKKHNITLVTNAVKKAVSKVKLAHGVDYEFDGENEMIMDALNQLLLMLLLGILLVYAIMAAQFQSLKSPFIIMFAIPLAITGGLLALIVTGKEISTIAMVGFVMLVGIIVNNGIVLVDYINQLRASGMGKRDAITKAGMTRIRPILMTTLTTVCGLIVMAIGKTAGTDMMQPIAIVCIGGLLYATFLTLFIIPCIYDIFHKEEYKFISEEDLDTTGII